MARPAIDKEKYFDAIKQMICKGLRVEEITPTKIQRIVGGQYSRCVQIIDEYFRQTDKVEESPMPIWFNDFVNKVTMNAQATWPIVNGEIRNSIDGLTSNFDQKCSRFEVQRREDLEQIKELEVTIARQEEELSSITEDKHKQLRLIAELQGEITSTKNGVADLLRRNNALEREKTDLAALHKIAQITIGQHEKSGADFEHKIKAFHNEKTQSDKEYQEMIRSLEKENNQIKHRETVEIQKNENLVGQIDDLKQQVEKLIAKKDSEQMIFLKQQISGLKNELCPIKKGRAKSKQLSFK
nr:hypothetical protein [Desulfobulbaceae bacterium]